MKAEGEGTNSESNQGSKLRDKLDADRRTLLDLSLRNTLLNFRVLKSRGVEVEDELPEQVLKILVDDSRPMSFLPAKEDEAEDQSDREVLELLGLLEFDQPEEEDNGNGIASRHTDNKLQTPHSSQVLQRRLLNSFYAARSSIEEHGVNTLFLALGMLHWYEADQADKERLAPLILVPVELTRSSVKSKFKIRHTGDDIGINLSLQQKLKLEFRVNLPEIADDEDLDLQDYFRRVEIAVQELPRWRVAHDAIQLGFFSFAKFLMYEDLDVENWPRDASPGDHIVLSSLLEEGFGEAGSGSADNGNLDERLDAADAFNIWDADSSQSLAILDALSGRNLVIQGPPGTGKSQTITNLISECIAQGKKVLFVAEKMAALEVVKRRLDNADLGVACLELHSHKSNRKAVLEELRRTLELGEPRTKSFDEDIQTLSESRDRLNAYCREVHTPIGESSVTPFQAYGALLQLDRFLEDIEAPALENEEIRKWGKPDLERRLRLTDDLETLIASIGTPDQHLFWGSGRKLLLPADQEKVAESAARCTMLLDELVKSAIQASNEIGLAIPSSLLDVSVLLEACDRVLSAPTLDGVTVGDSRWSSDRESITTLFDRGHRLQRLHLSNDDTLLPESWDEDVLETRKNLAMYGRKWWRLLSSEYRHAKRVSKGLFETNPPKNTADHLEVLDAILDAQRLTRHLTENQELVASLLGHHWKGYESDWNLLPRVSEFLGKLHADVSTGTASERLVEYLASEPKLPQLKSLSENLAKGYSRFTEELKALFQLVELDEGVRFGDAGIGAVSVDDLFRILSSWQDQTARLQEMVRFNHLASEMVTDDLEPLVKVSQSWPEAGRSLRHLLAKAWYDGLIEEALKASPFLAAFDAGTHELTLKRFRHLDAWLQERNRVVVAHKHWQGLPRQGVAGQAGTLRREFEKKRRHLPIRKLLSSAGQAIQAIKPVFMMSPLSVAAYIPPGTLDFDLVIFDEASQVTPVEAYGAILRGKQVVVVGDSKQLPPTPFFEKLGEVDEDEEIEGLGSELESVLGQFVSKNAPQKMLRWHYRSRHESLIAVSNHEFYDNRLLVFPSPETDRSNLGLVFHHLAHTEYKRGRGQSYNPKEAQAVAQAVMEHARKRPDQTLGVAAFSQRQMQAILDALEFMRREDPSLEGFFGSHPEEPFFVKNLENVQGDERDVIFISIGYGKTAEGYLAMNFGPLNKDGGERRLNVLISRARNRCEVFSNITAEDLDLRRSNAIGVAALKIYLKYAQTGNLDVPDPSGKEADSVFEEEVASRIRQHGYEVDNQVGSAGFFVDLAVRDPDAPGRYLIGIECDGATYHSAAWARDRDRLRQQVLEEKGWRIHRIWSTDWFLDPNKALRRALEAIEAARKVPPAGSGGSSTHGGGRSQTNNSVDRHPSENTGDSTLKGEPYRLAQVQVRTYGADLHQVPASTLAGCIQQIVGIEGPIHFNEVAARIAHGAGVRQVGGRIRRVLKSALESIKRTNKVRVSGEFIWSAETQTPAVRDRSDLPASGRKIDFIAPEEQQEALMQVVAASIGIDKDAACQQASRLLGFSRMGDGIQQHLNTNLRKLVASGRLQSNDGHLTLGSQP